MICDFEFAYLLYLLKQRGSSHDFRESMIQCGVAALLEGRDEPAIAVLAGADTSESPELVQIFVSAAREFGVTLPEPQSDCEQEWFARQLVEAIGRGRLLDESNHAFQTCLALIRLKTERWTHPAVRAIFESYRSVGSYDSWLSDLRRRATALGQSAAGPHEKDVCGRYADLILGTAWSDAEAKDVAQAGRLLVDVLRTGV